MRSTQAMKSEPGLAGKLCFRNLPSPAFWVRVPTKRPLHLAPSNAPLEKRILSSKTSAFHSLFGTPRGIPVAYVSMPVEKAISSVAADGQETFRQTRHAFQDMYRLIN